MRLQGRNLRAGMAGEDVAALHVELEAVGYDIPENERRDNIFGVGTAGAVAAFQKSRGLWDTAVVDTNTATMLGRAATEVAAETIMMPTVKARPSQPATPPPASAPPAAPPPAAPPPSAPTPPAPTPPAAPPAEAAPPTPPEAPLPSAPPAAGAGLTAADVTLLHEALSAIGIEVADAERDEHRFGPTTREAVTRLQALMGMEPNGEVDANTLGLARAALDRMRAHAQAAAAGDEWTVAGTVTDHSGLPMPGVLVVAEQRDLRDAHEVGRSPTDAEGRYRIAYSTATTVDLQLRILGKDGAPLFTSEVFYHVEQRAEIPLALGGPARSTPTEFAGVARTLLPRLGQLRPEELTENDRFQDLTFLAGDTGLTKPRIAFYSAAARLSRTTDLPPELFYALLRQNVPADAPVAVVASSSAGIDLDRNAERLLQSMLAASPRVRRSAVQTALTKGILPPDYAARVEDDLARLDQLAVGAALASTNGMGKTPISEVLSAAEVPADKQEKFMSLYAAASGPTRMFWRDLRRNPEFTKEDVAALRFATNVGRFTRGHLPLINSLVDLKRRGEIKGTRDLARLSASDWKAVILGGRGGEPTGIPANFTAQDQVQAVDAYAHILERNFERAHPTTAFSARLAEDPSSPFVAKDAMTAFLDANPGFNLLRTNVDSYLKGSPQPVVRDSLLTAQRLLKLTSRYAVAKPLLADRIQTSQQVYAMGQSRFVSTYQDHPDIGAAQAARIYAIAEQTYALSMSLVMNYNASWIGVQPKVIPAPPPEPPQPPVEQPQAAVLSDYPNLQTLFGSLDLCACKHCRSVLSPAAYLVDLLQFLSHRMTNGKSAKTVLLQRRPDLAQIELTCPNTNTVLPYIDLVNELLEDAVAPPADPIAAARARQTTLTTDELNANPQYVNAGAYTVLANAVYPWHLPFDLPLAEARTYLGVLGTDRVTLMRAFQPPAAIPSPQATALAVEGLGLSAVEADIITGGPLAAAYSSWDFWGLAETGNTVPDPQDHTVAYAGSWLDVLAHVRVLLDRSDLSYQSLTQVLNTVFVNPAGAVTLQCNPADSCDLGTMTVVGLTQDVLDRLHRFVRLHRRLGWDVYTTDAAIANLATGTPNGLGRLSNTLLRQLYAVKTAAKRFRLPVASAVALLGRIDPRDVPRLPGEDEQRYALYHDLFQNLAVLNPVDAVFALNSDGSEIAAIGSNPKLADHHATLVAAFEVTDADLSLAISALTDGALTVANLTVLHRNILLARGLGLSIRELLALLALVEVETDTTPFHELVNPFDLARPERLGMFCDEVDRIRHTKFSIVGLDYLLRHVFEATTGVAPDDVTVGTLLKSIRDKLLKVAAENAPTADPTGAEVRRRLSTVLGKPDVDAMMAVLAGTSALSTTDQETLISDTLGGFLDATAAKTALVGGGALAAGEARFEYVLSRMLAYFRRSLGTSLVVQELADTLSLPTATLAVLLGQPVIEHFLALPEVARDPVRTDQPIAPDEVGFTGYFSEYAALDKAAEVVSGFGLSTDETSWLLDFGVGLGWLDPTTLPLAPTVDPQGAYRRWVRLAEAAAVKAALPSDGTPFTALMDLARTGAGKTTYLTALAKRTQWTMESLTVLAGDPANTADEGVLALAYPADYTSERALARLVRAFGQLRRLGIAADVSGWLGATVSAPQADTIKQSVKAKYSTERWAAVAKPIRDVLREQQRDALVGYLLAHPPSDVKRWHDANDVYARYLIDVEMSACQGTSRIVQANATIQLFVQRCILNLEPAVVVDAQADGDWRQWKWISRYRVWEANRKVFLYPENWIQPALRRDKSPFFADLENELLQGEVTKDSAEDAFRAYLEKLDGVARLDVVGVFHEASDPTVLHVIGRKQGNPPVYYYRQWIDSSRWTAWTKVDLDITSDHVVPVVWNRRPYLFWATVNRKPDQTQSQPQMQMVNAQPPATKVHLEIQLAWSEYKGKKWQPTQTAPQVLVVQGESDPFQVTVKSSLADPLLRIDLFVENGEGRGHFAEFALGGVGNSVEAYATYLGGNAGVGSHTRAIGKLPSALELGVLAHPTNSGFDGMQIVPATSALSQLSPQRPRVGIMHTTYDYYGSLSSEAVLNKADRYRLLVPHQNVRFDSSLPFFFADGRRSYFLIPTVYYQNGNYFTTTAPAYVYHPYYKAEYRFAPFYHAFVPLFIRQLNAGGVDRLFERNLQLDPAGIQGSAPFNFKSYYDPTDNVIKPYPTEGVDFEPEAGYSIYNWELFFHAPFQIGDALSRNQRFEEAKHWYEYIFNPTSATNDPVPRRFWITKPFYNMTAADYWAQKIENLIKLINAGDAAAEHQVAQWRANPFEPHVIAALRPVAYQRAIVMRYIDNLIAWGDQLFRQDTMESVNEATQLYVLAAELLGERPEIVPSQVDSAAMTYADLEPRLDDFANAVAAAENVVPPVKVNVPVDPDTPKLPLIPPLYFCVPPNEQLLKYWDTVADRLFKVRHCMNIEGVVRQLALFAPPIDPGLLVKAVAAGLDLGSVLSDTNAALPPYRFRVMVRQAMELAGSVRELGSELLMCLERRDAEKLELLRSGAERKLQEQVKAVHTKQVEEANQQLDVLAKNRSVVKVRQDYFGGLKQDLMNPWEIAAMAATGGSVIAQALSMSLDTTSAAAHAAPDAQFGGSGAGGSPHVTAKYGGENVGKTSGAVAKVARVAAAALQTLAQMASTMAMYQRRQDEWVFQYDLATADLDQVDAQSLAATIRRDLLAMEKDNHEIVAKLAADTDDMLHDRFTNLELYEWMIGQTSATYFQAYQLAFTVAKRAEQCMRRELGLTDTSFVQFGYWDSLKKGLLTADKLLYDLRRMEAAYLAQHERELELTKNVSLLTVDPYALVELRNTGECTVRLPELLFDLENPGHHLRRLKTVGLTVPCVVGPYTGVSMTLTLLDNHIRTSTDTSPQYARSTGDDLRFVDDPGGVSAVVTSTGQNDSGLFELRLDDERYLPFEGSGAVSTWKLRLNPVYSQFDHATISDVVLHLRYTARDAGEPLAIAARDTVRNTLNAIALAESRTGLYRLVSARQEYSTEWYAFLHPGGEQDQVLTLDTAPDRFPFLTNGLDIKVTGIDVLARLADPGDYSAVITRPGGPPLTLTMSVDSTLGGLHHAEARPLAPKSDLGRAPAHSPYPQWTVKVRKSGAVDFRSLSPEEIDDLVIIFQYEVSA